jgi:hypothetical protein
MICGARKVSPIIRVTQQQLITSVIAGSAVKVDRLGSKLESVDQKWLAKYLHFTH